MTDHEQDTEDTTTETPEPDVGDHHYAGCHYSDEGGQEWGRMTCPSDTTNGGSNDNR